MRLIDADELINNIQYNLWDWESVDGITATTVLKQTITDIKNALTIDAVPVVRCKDCKWWVAHPKWQTENGYCKYMLVLFYVAKKADDYCSCGERRNGERVYLQSR